MRLRIIIFEDDQISRELLVRSIGQLGHEVLAFSDPLACPLYTNDDCSCSQYHPCGDLLISDNRMPRMTGLEFVRRQTEQGCKGVAVNKALISGSWTDPQRLEAQRLGCKILCKPFSLEELLNWIREREASINPERQLADLSAP